MRTIVNGGALYSSSCRKRGQEKHTFHVAIRLSDGEVVRGPNITYEGHLSFPKEKGAMSALIDSLADTHPDVNTEDY